MNKFFRNNMIRITDSRLGEMISLGILLSMLGAVWLIAGIILSAPYVWLSGWNEEAFVNFTFILPPPCGAIAIVTYFSWIASSRGKQKGPLIALGCIYAWLLLPIEINLFVGAMHLVGFNNLAINLLYEARFSSLSITFIAAIFGLFVWCFLSDMIYLRKKNSQPVT